MTNSIRAGGSLFHGITVICVPDDDDEARQAGISDEIIEAATQTNVVGRGLRTIYCRASVFEKLKAAIPAA